MSLPRYSEYKDSGVAWLNSVPVDWMVRRLGFFFEERREKVSDKDFPALSVTKSGIVPQLETAAKTDDGDNRKKVCAGDFVINSRSDRKGSAGASSLDGSVSLINTVLRPLAGIDIGFVHHLLRSIPFQEEFYRYGKGIVADLWSTNYSEMRNIVLALPSIPEQTAIATFLDRETGKIDALIAEQEKLLALLAEKRQATISHAVTKGLNPDAPMKDSGVAWLGEVPGHWLVGKAGFYISVLPGYAFSSAGFSIDENNVKLLRGINVGVGELRWDEVVYWSRTEDDGLEAFELHEGDVVIGMDRPLISTGMRVAVVKNHDLPCLLLQRVAKIQAGPLIDRRFIMRLLCSRAFEAHFAPDTTGVSVPHISGEQILNFVIPVPPQDEQQQICEFLESELAKLDSLNYESERAIALLKERRSALIAAAVTGQIDVRGLVTEPEAA
ncbi:restriction endonuclease subunit S [Azonexus sp. IMCC34839]|uniref:restriction endonuclease subunit S n=1 Tax=Azonexus sp. IMCC34839 TaxID=3133695 RepID=UPI00399AF4B6